MNAYSDLLAVVTWGKSKEGRRAQSRFSWKERWVGNVCHGCRMGGCWHAWYLPFPFSGRESIKMHCVFWNMHSVWFHVQEGLEQKSWFMVRKVRIVVTWVWVGGWIMDWEGAWRSFSVPRNILHLDLGGNYTDIYIYKNSLSYVPLRFVNYTIWRSYLK